MLIKSIADIRVLIKVESEFLGDTSYIFMFYLH